MSGRALLRQDRIASGSERLRIASSLCGLPLAYQIGEQPAVLFPLVDPRCRQGQAILVDGVAHGFPARLPSVMAPAG